MCAVTDEEWLIRAVDLAVANVADGGGPFGALVVRGERLLGAGTNRVTTDLDPSAHAEVVAIRSACRELGDFSLEGCTLYASCEPCPMCLGAALWARVNRVVYAADRDDAAAGGFDDRLFHDLLAGRGGDRWPLSLEHVPTDRLRDPFTAWTATPGRTEY